MIFSTENLYKPFKPFLLVILGEDVPDLEVMK